MRYRFATLDDLDALAEWNHQLIRDEGHRNCMTVFELRQRLEAWLGEDYRAVIFESDAEAVAYALYREDDREIYLRHLFVKRNRRREGIGRRAVDILRNVIWGRSQRLTVDVLTANSDGIKFWRSVGYKDYCLTLEIVPEAKNK